MYFLEYFQRFFFSAYKIISIKFWHIFLELFCAERATWLWYAWYNIKKLIRNNNIYIFEAIGITPYSNAIGITPYSNAILCYIVLNHIVNLKMYQVGNWYGNGDGNIIMKATKKWHHISWNYHRLSN
jgi:hypothetical protein